jgi:hypothetical protein
VIEPLLSIVFGFHRTKAFQYSFNLMHKQLFFRTKSFAQSSGSNPGLFGYYLQLLFFVFPRPFFRIAFRRKLVSLTEIYIERAEITEVFNRFIHFGHWNRSFLRFLISIRS